LVWEEELFGKNLMFVGETTRLDIENSYLKQFMPIPNPMFVG
jgi:hypothetical protein